MTNNQNNSTSHLALSGMFWTFAERVGAQLVTFIVTIILARILGPDEYALVAIVMVFLVLADVFVTSGFGSSLVQKLDVDHIDFSTTFFFSLGFSLIIYLILFLLAPYIAKFYEMEQLTLVIRVMSIRIVFASVNSVQQAYVARKLQFRKFFKSTLIGAIVSAIIGIFMAYTGYGVWALVAQYLINVAISTFVLWCISGWHLTMDFSFERMKSLFSFGWKVMVSNVYHELILQARALVLGKLASPRELSFYNQGEKFPALFINNIETSIQKVMAPIISLEQKDLMRVLFLTRKTIQVASFIIWPLIIGLSAVSESLIEILFTEKWLGCVPYLKLICVAYMFAPISEAHVRTIRAIGRSDVTLKTTCSVDTFNIIILAIAILFHFNGIGIVCTLIVASMTMMIINGVADRTMIGYRLRDQFKDLLPTGISVIIMYLAVSLLSVVPIDLFVKIIIQTVVGIIIYIVCSYFMNRDVFVYVFRMGLSYIEKIRNR